MGFEEGSGPPGREADVILGFLLEELGVERS
jgi:hypothetical protein